MNRRQLFKGVLGLAVAFVLPRLPKAIAQPEPERYILAPVVDTPAVAAELDAYVTRPPLLVEEPPKPITVEHLRRIHRQLQENANRHEMYTSVLRDQENRYREDVRYVTRRFIPYDPTPEETDVHS